MAEIEQKNVVGTVAPLMPLENTKYINDKFVLQTRIRRNENMELCIYFKSNQDWRFLAHKTEKRTVNIGGVECWWPAKDRLNGVPGLFYSDSILEVQEYPNLSMLLAKDIKNGIEYNFGSFPISQKHIEDLLIKLKESVKALYCSFCAPFDIETNFTTEVVERERIN